MNNIWPFDMHNIETAHNQRVLYVLFDGVLAAELL